MNIKISYKRFIMNLLVLVWILLEVKWFYLPSDTHSILVKYNFEGKNFAIVVISFAMLFCQLLLYRTKKRHFIFRNQIYIIWAIWFIAYAYAVLFYSQDPSYTFVQFVFFGVYAFYFAALWYFDYAEGYQFFSTALALGTAIFSTLIIFQVYNWHTGGRQFLTVLEYLESDFVTRYGVVRVMAPAALISISSVISFARLFQEQKRKSVSVLIDIVNVVSGTIYVFYACGTRFLMLVIMITYGIILICRKERFHPLRNVIIYIIVVCAVYYLITENLLARISFSTTEHSYIYRMDAFAYFLKQGIINPVCGLGFLTDRAVGYANVLHGSEGKFYISDVGICGFAGQMGIIAASAYMMMVLKIWKTNAKIKRITGKINMLVLSLALYSTLTLLTLSLQNNYTIVAMVLCLIFTEHEYDRVERLSKGIDRV